MAFPQKSRNGLADRMSSFPKKIKVPKLKVKAVRGDKDSAAGAAN